MSPTNDPTNEPEQDPAPDSTAASSMQGSKLPDRRTFFKKGALDLITIAGTVRAMRNPFAGSSLPDRETKAYPHSDEPLSFPSTGTFRNLGVLHAGEYFELDREHLLDAIKDCDTVLLEGCTGQSYFDFMAGLAFEEGKDVVRLESDISSLSGLGMVASPTIRMLTILFNGLHYVDRVLANPRRKKQIQNRILKAKLLGHVIGEVTKRDPVAGLILHEEVLESLGKDIPVLSEPTKKRAGLTLLADVFTRIFEGTPNSNYSTDPDDYAANDWSHLLDGRTVLMLGEVRKYMESHPDKNVLVISGDYHARGFTYYLKSDENLARFDRKLRLYNRIYKPWLGGNAEEEQDPRSELED